MILCCVLIVTSRVGSSGGTNALLPTANNVVAAAPVNSSVAEAPVVRMAKRPAIQLQHQWSATPTHNEAPVARMASHSTSSKDPFGIPTYGTKRHCENLEARVRVLQHECRHWKKTTGSLEVRFARMEHSFKWLLKVLNKTEGHQQWTKKRKKKVMRVSPCQRE